MIKIFTQRPFSIICEYLDPSEEPLKKLVKELLLFSPVRELFNKLYEDSPLPYHPDHGEHSKHYILEGTKTLHSLKRVCVLAPGITESKSGTLNALAEKFEEVFLVGFYEKLLHDSLAAIHPSLHKKVRIVTIDLTHTFDFLDELVLNLGRMDITKEQKIELVIRNVFKKYLPNLLKSVPPLSLPKGSIDYVVSHCVTTDLNGGFKLIIEGVFPEFTELDPAYRSELLALAREHIQGRHIVDLAHLCEENGSLCLIDTVGYWKAGDPYYPGMLSLTYSTLLFDHFHMLHSSRRGWHLSSSFVFDVIQQICKPKKKEAPKTAKTEELLLK